MKWMKGMVAAACLLLPSYAVAGPFGINMGDPLSKYRVEKELDNGLYKLAAVPVPRSDVDFVTVVATPAHGICKVQAAGKTLDEDADGYDIRREFAALKGALTAKYGPSKDFNFLHVGAIWDGPREYAMALHKKERTLASFWMRKEGSTLTDDLQSVSLTARGLSSSSTYWHLSYEFANFEACISQLESKDDAAL